MDDSAPKDVLSRSEPQGTQNLGFMLWRLLDWRFLLPCPQPKTLAYGGKSEPAMEEALRLLNPEAGRLSGSTSHPSRQYEVVFLSYPDLPLLRTGCQAVASDGWLCIRARQSFRSFRGPKTLMGWQRLLRRQGFTDVRVDWHAPKLDCPSRIVPVASRSAVLDTLSRHQGIRFGLIKQQAGRLALNLGLFGALIPEGTVTGRRYRPEAR